MKRLKLIGCFVALAAIVGVNVWKATTVIKESELTIEDVEAIADPPEWDFWDTFCQDMEYYFTGKNKMKWYEFTSYNTVYGNVVVRNVGEVCDYSNDNTDAGCGYYQFRWWSVEVG